MTPDLERLRKALKVFREYEKTLRFWRTTGGIVQRGTADHICLLRGDYPLNETMGRIVDIYASDFQKLADAADAVLGKEAGDG